jgi:hypothetical protein
VSLAGQTDVQHTGFIGATFRLAGRCTFAEMHTGHRVLLIWPAGHVAYDRETGTVSFTDLFGDQVTTFTDGQVLDFRVTPGSGDRGYRPLEPSAFVVPPDPSCPDQDVAIVTGVTIHELTGEVPPPSPGRPSPADLRQGSDERGV